MQDEIELNEEHQETLGIKAMYYDNIVDRYFDKFYVDENTDKEQYIFIHTNGVVMCGLGKNHSIVKSGIKIKEVKDLNKLTKISGKRKHGAHGLNDHEYIVQIITEDPNNSEENITFNFSPKVKGKLIEINESIFSKPEIIQQFPEKHGFICFLLLQDPKAAENFREKLIKLKNK